LADYDRRLRKLEERTAADDDWDAAIDEVERRVSESLRRTEAMLGLEPLPAGQPSDYDPEFKAWFEALKLDAKRDFEHRFGGIDFKTFWLSHHR
jgi:hypothetical protein